jgi:EAL domain-containing protein (putative c-di-GMP-specific phosphodiesterase class I)
MVVVAEGVETASQVNKLKALGCDEMQGFLLGKPLAADAFGELLRGVRA